MIASSIITTRPSTTTTSPSLNWEIGKGGMRKGGIGKSSLFVFVCCVFLFTCPIPPFLIPPFPFSRLNHGSSGSSGAVDAHASSSRVPCRPRPNAEVWCPGPNNTTTKNKYYHYYHY